MTDKTFSPFIDFLQLFKNIPSADVETICDHLSFRKVSNGDALLNEGRVAKELFFVCKGILKIVSTTDKGNVVVQFFLKENQFCTNMNSFLNGVPANEGIEAASDAELIVFSKQKLNLLYDQLPYLKELIDGITKQALLDKIQIRNSYMGEDATTRYRKFILRQSDIALRVPLSDIASYLGITQQSLSRIRRSIK